MDVVVGWWGGVATVDKAVGWAGGIAAIFEVAEQGGEAAVADEATGMVEVPSPMMWLWDIGEWVPQWTSPRRRRRGYHHE